MKLSSVKGAFNNYVDKKRGRGLNVHVDQNLVISESISYYVLCTVLGDKKK